MAANLPESNQIIMKKLLLALVLILPLSATSCIGSFGTFHKLLDWNKTATESKWGNELIFFGLYVFPVYSICLLGDVVIFNSIEFWTDENPMTSGS